MSKRYAIVANGVVTNVVLWDGSPHWAPPNGSSANLLPDDSIVGSGYTFDGTNYVEPVPVAPVLSPAQKVQALIGAGLTINSTSTPAINGLYAIDKSAQFDIDSVTSYVTVNNAFPGHTPAYPWRDLNGQFHTFPSVALFKLWATAIADYVAQLTLYAAGSAGVALPAPVVTIP